MLKKLFLTLSIVVFSTAAAQAADAAPAALPAVKVAVVDIQRIMKDSLAAKDLKAQLEAKRNQYQAEIKAKEDKLKKEEEDLAKQKSVLAKDALTAKQKAFVDDINAVRKDVQDKRVKLDNGYKNALNEIQKVVQGIIDDLAKEKGFNLAIPNSQLVYAHRDFDISDEVLKRLDAKLPKVALKFDK